MAAFPNSETLRIGRIGVRRWRNRDRWFTMAINPQVEPSRWESLIDGHAFEVAATLLAAHAEIAQREPVHDL